jgi:effector-binding domain-containing protein
MSLGRSIAATLVALAALAASAAAQQPSTPAAPPAAPAKPAFDVQVKTSEPVHAVVLPMKGSYMQHPDAFSKLAGYLSGKGIAPGSPAFGRYFSDPSVGETNLVWEVGFPIAAGVSVEAPYEIKDLPAVLCATHVHRGPIEELGAAWGTLAQWAISNGYQPAVPAVQRFNGDMSEVEMLMPVRK